MTEHDRHRDLIDLILVDYDATRARANAFAVAANAIRALAVTILVALIGLAIDRPSWALGVCAIIGAAVFAGLDAYHGWLYVISRARAAELETILALRYKALERVNDSNTVGDLDAALAAHRFGPHSNVEKFETKFLLKARPVQLYVGLYGVLLLLAAGSVFYAEDRTHDKPAHIRTTQTTSTPTAP